MCHDHSSFPFLIAFDRQGDDMQSEVVLYHSFIVKPNLYF